MQSRTRARLSLATSIAIIGVFLGSILYRQTIYDSTRVRAYTPSSQVQALVDDTSMTDAAEKTFYTTHPFISDAADFNNNCPTGEHTIVLGCYVNKGNGFLHRGDIFLFGVDDARLDGVLQVTAAHEMLHAEYERLPSDEKTRINGLLEQAFAGVTDERIRATVEQYRKQDPSSVVNELHSILGTEVRDLNTELENYYKQYFTNRAAIVAFSEKYEQEFSSRQTRVADFDARLETMKADIDDDQRAINDQVNELQAEQITLDAYRKSGDSEAYNARATSYNEGVRVYNELVRSTRSLIEEYNVLVVQRNEVASEVDQLVKAIDSRPQTL